LDQFADLAETMKIALIVDETYRDFVALEADGTRGKPHRLFERPNWGGNVISLFSFSKSYKVPGHRLGGLVAGTAVRDHVTKVLDCLQVCRLNTMCTPNL
jgi:aspartate/methionine/tyrosine aminotransferase